MFADTVRRLFVGGLPENVTEDDIKRRLKSFGTIYEIELIMNKKPFNVNLCRGFAFVKINISDENLLKCQSVYQHTRWHGKYLRIEEALPSYLERLNKEHNNNNNNNNSDEEQEEKKEEIDWNQYVYVWRKARGMRRIMVQANQNRKTFNNEDFKKLVFKKPIISLNDSSSSEDDDHHLENDPFLSKIRDLSSSSSSSEESSSSSSEESMSSSSSEESMSSSSSEESMSSSSSEESMSSSSSEESMSSSSISDGNINEKDNKSHKKKHDGDLQRKIALEANIKRLAEKKEILKRGLANLSRNNRKLLVDTDNIIEEKKEKDIIQQHIEPAKIENWMSSSSDEEDDNSINVNDEMKEIDSHEEAKNMFRIRPEFEGEDGENLLNLQRSYKGDERFRLDDRFRDDDDDDVEDDDHNDNIIDDNSPNENINNSDVSEEDMDSNQKVTKKEKLGALAILDELVPEKYYIHDRRNTKKPTHMFKTVQRFDPSQFKKSKTEKNLVKNVMNKDNNPIPKPIVSDEIFVKVSTNLFEKDKDEVASSSSTRALFSEETLNTPFKLFDDDNNNNNNNEIINNDDEIINNNDEKQNVIINNTNTNESNKLDQDKSTTTMSMKERLVQLVTKTSINKNEMSKKKHQKNVVPLLGSSFMRTEPQSHMEQKWVEKRKHVTMDFKKKHRTAIRNKKRQDKRKRRKMN